MGCCCTTPRVINGAEALPLIQNCEAAVGRLDPKPDATDGFMDNMVNEANADRKSIKVQKVLLLYNPMSGNGLGETNQAILENLLTEEKIEVTKKVSEHAGHLIEIGKTMDFSAYDCVAVCGGDGSLSELLQGIIPRDIKVPIALCPGGTGNGLATSMKIFNPQDAAQTIISGSHIAVDINRIVDATNKTYYSMNVTGAGLTYDAVEVAEKMRCCGSMRYDCAALGLFCCCYSVPMEMELDGYPLSVDASAIFVMNNTCMGSGSHCTPYNSATDGYFDVWILPLSSLGKELKVMDAIKTSEHMYMPSQKNTYFRGKRLKYSSEGGVCVDGENCSQAPFEIECLSKSWRMMHKLKPQSGKLIDL